MDLQQSFHGYAPSQTWLEDRPAVRKNVEERIRPSGGVVELRPIYPGISRDSRAHKKMLSEKEMPDWTTRKGLPHPQSGHSLHLAQEGCQSKILDFEDLKHLMHTHDHFLRAWREATFGAPSLVPAASLVMRLVLLRLVRAPAPIVNGVSNG